jgi:hypothetical protein
MIKTIVMMTPLIFVIGCSTLKDSTLLGVGIGSAVGAGLGAAVSAPRGHETRGAITGAAVGAALGGLIGFFDHKERAKKQRSSLGLTPDHSDSPFLTKPTVQRLWVPEKIEGDKFISGHWIYVIERPSVWSKD